MSALIIRTPQWHRTYVKEERKRSRVGDPPLQGMIAFQGLDIMVENQKGTERQWGPKPDQKNHMYYDYGYVVGTMGWDGDEVDVYIGPNECSENVFIVTQMKKESDFKEVDEQKVFLGFDTVEQVREAYLHQYNDPRFLGSIEHITVNVFKLRLALTGSTRKALKTLTISARIPNISSVSKGSKSVEAVMEKVPEKDKISKPFQSQAQRGKFYAMAERGDISKETLEEWESATPKGKKLPEKKKMNKSRARAIDILKAVGCPPAGGDELDKDVTEKGLKESAGSAASGAFEAAKPKLQEAGVAAVGGAAQALAKPKAAKALDKDDDEEDVEKALRSTVIAGIAKRARMHAYTAGVAAPQPTIGTNRVRGEHEPPVVPVRRVETPFAVAPAALDTLTDCKQCGYLHKSLDDCPRCARVASIGGEAKPLHFRGR